VGGAQDRAGQRDREVPGAFLTRSNLAMPVARARISLELNPREVAGELDRPAEGGPSLGQHWLR
jgi:hypothetical protein